MPYEPYPYVRALGEQGPEIQRVSKAELHALMGNFAAATAFNSNESAAQVARYRQGFEAQTSGARAAALRDFYSRMDTGGPRVQALGQQAARNVGVGVVQFINNTEGAQRLMATLGASAQNWPALMPAGGAAFAQSFSAVVPFLSAALDLANWWTHRDDEQEQREAAVNSASWMRHWLRLLNQGTLEERFGVNRSRAITRARWSEPLLNEINKPLFARAAQLAVEYCRQGQQARGPFDSGGCRRGVHGVGNRAATEVLGIGWWRYSYSDWRKLPGRSRVHTPENAVRYANTAINENLNRQGEAKDSISRVWSGIMQTGADATPAAVTMAQQERRPAEPADRQRRNRGGGRAAPPIRDEEPMARTSISDPELRSMVQRDLRHGNPNKWQANFNSSNRSGRAMRVASGSIIYPGQVYGIGVTAREAFAMISGPTIASAYENMPANHALLLAGAHVRADGNVSATLYRWKMAGRARPSGWRSIGVVSAPANRVNWRRLAGLAAPPPPDANPTPDQRPGQADPVPGPAPAPDMGAGGQFIPDSNEAADGAAPPAPPPPPAGQAFSAAETAGIGGSALLIGLGLAAWYTTR
jgi:hypothetical protein